MQIRRLCDKPIITPETHPRVGANITGPSLIRVPDWFDNGLGAYYLYFASHAGSSIRLAYADDLCGPWTLYEPGVLALDQSGCKHHIASPDVHIDDEKREFRMYYHGVIPGPRCNPLLLNIWRQKSKVSLSRDGLLFQPTEEVFGTDADDHAGTYFRVFHWNSYHYVAAMYGMFFRSRDGLTNFEQGPTLFTENLRHLAVDLRENTLRIYFSNAHDCPETILLSTVELTDDWLTWTATDPVTVMVPGTPYEGVDLPLEPSERDAPHGRVRELRDPAVFKEEGRTYLLYTVAGESGIAIAEVLE